MVMRTTNGVLFPAEVSKDIWAKANEASLVMQKGSKIDMPASGGEIQIVTGEAVASWTGEGQRKPATDAEFGVKTFAPSKASVVQSFSDEFKRDKSALYNLLVPRLADSLAVLLDNAALHGLNVPSAKFDHLGNAQEVVFDGSYAGILNALRAVAAEGGDVTDFLVGAEAELALLGAVDGNGRPLFTVNPQNDGTIGSLLGRNVTKHSRAAAKSAAEADTLGLAGPMSKLMWGMVEGIKYEFYDGPIYSGSTLVHAGRQDGMTSVIVDFEVGVLIKDPQEFVRLVAGTGTTPETPDAD